MPIKDPAGVLADAILQSVATHTLADLGLREYVTNCIREEIERAIRTAINEIRPEDE
jgi:hypothetical protein